MEIPIYLWFLMVSGALFWVGLLVFGILVWWAWLVSDESEVPNKIPRGRRIFRKRWATQ